MPAEVCTFSLPRRGGKELRLRLVRTAYLDSGSISFVVFVASDGMPYTQLSREPAAPVGELEFVADANSRVVMSILDHLPFFTPADRRQVVEGVSYPIWTFNPAEVPLD